MTHFFGRMNNASRLAKVDSTQAKGVSAHIGGPLFGVLVTIKHYGGDDVVTVELTRGASSPGLLLDVGAWTLASATDDAFRREMADADNELEDEGDDDEGTT